MLEIRKQQQVLFIFLFLTLGLSAQNKKSILKDTVDNHLDVSDYLINLHGFIPVPAIISEPALGNFGIALAPVFIAPQKSANNKDRFHFPDITAAFGMYTANKSWALGVFRMGSFPKLGLRYRVGGLYGDINMNFYRTIDLIGDKEFKFNFNAKGALFELSKNVYHNRVFLGLNYLFANSSIAYNKMLNLGGSFDPDDFESQIGNLGIFTDIDYRNSVFTPDKGLRVKATYALNRSFTASDYTYDRYEFLVNLFLNPTRRWVSGFRIDAMAVDGDVPFYSNPFVSIRGIPMLRYQGQQTLVFETEQRYDFTNRWSMVAFVGTGKAFSTQKFNEVNENWNWSGGAGFRYLIARLFKLRVGIDIARGPENFAYYVVFGHNWNR